MQAAPPRPWPHAKSSVRSTSVRGRVSQNVASRFGSEKHLAVSGKKRNEATVSKNRLNYAYSKNNKLLHFYASDEKFLSKHKTTNLVNFA